MRRPQLQLEETRYIRGAGAQDHEEGQRPLRRSAPIQSGVAVPVKPGTLPPRSKTAACYVECGAYRRAGTIRPEALAQSDQTRPACSETLCRDDGRVTSSSAERRSAPIQSGVANKSLRVGVPVKPGTLPPRSKTAAGYVECGARVPGLTGTSTPLWMCAERTAGLGQSDQKHWHNQTRQFPLRADKHSRDNSRETASGAERRSAPIQSGVAVPV